MEFKSMDQVKKLFEDLEGVHEIVWFRYSQMGGFFWMLFDDDEWREKWEMSTGEKFFSTKEEEIRERLKWAFEVGRMYGNAEMIQLIEAYPEHGEKVFDHLHKELFEGRVSNEQSI